MDGFAHRNQMDSWRGLIQSATNWGTAQKTSTLWSTVSIEDEEKLSLFESLGFKSTRQGEPIDIDGRRVGTLRCELM